MMKRGLNKASFKLGGGVWSFQKILLFLAVVVLVSLGFVESVDAAPSIEFVDPTPSDETNTINTTIEINVSITESSLGEMKFNWDGVNYTFYDNSLVLMYNFDNVSVLGENSTYAVDVSKYGNNGTIYGSTSWNSTGKYGGAFEFDGDGDYVVVNDSDSLDVRNITLSVWVKLNEGSKNQYILGKCEDINNQDSYRFFIDTNDKIKVIIKSGGTQGIEVSSNPVSIGSWFHLVLTYSPGVYKIYIDGEEDLNSGGGIASGNIDVGTGRLTIGARYDASESTYIAYFNGTMDEVRIWNKSLSANEVKQLYYGNLYKYDSDKWNFYINESDFNIDANTYFASTSDSSGNENLTETRTIRILAKTIDYYDNRKATVIFTADDWYGCRDYHNGFINASDAAQKYKVVFSPGIVPLGVFKVWDTCRAECPEACLESRDVYPLTALNNSQWNDIQTQIDEGFVSPVSHSMSHRGDVYNYTENGTSYEIEINGSKHAIIGNLTLPWQNWFNGSEYLVGWLEPYGYSDGQVRATLAESNYLADRSTSSGKFPWASWNTSDGLYNRLGVRRSGDTSNLTELNDSFSEAYSNGRIYHFYLHPRLRNWTETDKIPQHLSYIGNRTDVWYVGWGQLYMYHYLEDKVTPTLNLTTRNNQIITAKINASGEERNKYGLSYPVTYAFAVPSVWSNVFVFYKNQSSDDYTAMTEKTSTDFFNGIDAYRTNLSENGVYVSKGFPQTSNEFYLKIVPILSTNFRGDTTDLTTANLLNITNLVLENSNYGKINFSESVDLSSGADLNAHVDIAQNRIEINSTALPEVNRSATLTLYNLTFTNPRVLRDGSVCPSTICTTVSYSGGTLIFNVTSFSAYSAEETPTTTSETPSPSGGGYPTFKPSRKQLEEGYEKSLRKNWKMQFEFNNETHVIKLDEITNETAIITVSSQRVTFNLTVNETEKVNLDDDNYYDLQIFLKDISDYEADLIVKLIYEEIPKCEPNWECTEWSGCVNYTKMRTCTDLNNCNATEDKPDEVRDCCEPDWKCTEWSGCVSNIQTRICTDLNDCNVAEARPDEVRDCEPKTDYFTIVIVSALIAAVVIVVSFLVQKQLTKRKPKRLFR